MGETQGFNPEMGGHNIAELAKNPLKASDEVQKLTRIGNYKEAHKLLGDVLEAQERGGRDEEPREAMAA